MTSDRPYRRALALEAACGELRTNAGGQFDPRVAQALLEILGEEGSSPVAPTLAEQDSERVRTLRRLAADVGAEDLLVFRRVAPDVFCHLGGAGRGETWAGNIDLHPSSERHLVEALERGAPVVADPGRMGRVVGPYHARTAVVVPAADDLVVVFGSASESLHDASSERAQAVAEQATRLIDRVSPAKRLADELEVLDAVRAVATLAADDVPGTLAACAERAAAALSCEWAALGLLPSDGREALVGASGTGWSPPGPGSVEALVGSLAARIDELPLLIQDTSDEEGLAPGFRAEDGACSLHAIAVGEPPLGILVAVHATPGLRGFTALCQRVAHGVGDTAEPVVRRALAQERLTAENAALRRALRVDGMTGVTSRAGWEEAFHVEERRGGAVSVVVVDLDGLKAVNDRDGHAAGDALLRSCAGVLREISRPIDLVARLGGDEFGVLLRGVGEAQAADWSARLRERLACAGIPASLGVASSPPCPSPLAAVDVADRRMYEAKTAARPAPAGLA